MAQPPLKGRLATKHYRPKNKEMKPRDIFIKACNEIAVPFLERGFKSSKNGQCLKRISKDKDLTFEIWFRSSVYNTSCSVTIYPLITITSKSLKKWVQEERLNINNDDLVYHNHIGYLSPINEYKSWNLSGLSYTISVKTIIDLLEKYACPIFDLFENRQTAIDFITQHGCCFNQYTKDSLHALPYMLRYGEKEQAENYLNHYIHSNKCRNRFLKAYSQLEKNEVIDCGLDKCFVILAFNQKLKIK